jgi:hypothetical protein
MTIPEGHEVLTGHFEEASAYVVPDYPYGFRLRCKIRYWIEYNPKHGDRFCSQTTNPKVVDREVWNKPKKSTYTQIAVLTRDPENGHIQWAGLRTYPTDVELADFTARTDGKLGEWQAKTLKAITQLNAVMARKKAEREAAAAAAAEAAAEVVTCDGCDATSEAGWGDNPFCLDCSPADEVCDVHHRTFVTTCPICDAAADTVAAG